MALVVGMNSGSSVDNIDVVLIETTVGRDGVPTKPKLVDSFLYDWPEEIHRSIFKAIRLETPIDELSRLNYAVGAVFGVAVNKLLNKASIPAKDVLAIGIDGQTIYHRPNAFLPSRDISTMINEWMKENYANTLQIGEPAVISAITGITIVTQFRPADQALGGTGSPLMQYLDYVVFRDISPVATLNIGGIANVHLVDRDKNKMMAFDTGPGNVMIDYMAQHHFDKPYDPDGSIAASGRVDKKLLSELLEHPYFHLKPPKAVWRDAFNRKYIEDILTRYTDLPKNDLMATFCELTAKGIADSMNKYFPNLGLIKELITSGGGVENKTLMNSIQRHLPDHITVVRSDKYNIPYKLKEAIKFAVLAFATVHKIPNNVPSCSGAIREAILGKVCYPPA